MPRKRRTSQQKRKLPSRNPFYDENGNPTKKLRHLIRVANYENDRTNIVRHYQAHGDNQACGEEYAWLGQVDEHKRTKALLACGEEYAWVARDELTKAQLRCHYALDAEMLMEIAEVVKDYRDGFKKLRDRATIWVIRAYNELLTDPRFDEEQPGLEILKRRAIELLAQHEDRREDETFEEQKTRLEKQVRYTTLLRDLRPKDFARIRRGRPPK